MNKALLLLAWIGAVVGAAIVLAGGVDMHVGSLPIRAHNPYAAFIVSLVCVGVAWRRGTAPVLEALSWWWTMLEKRASVLAAVAALCAVAIGVVWGTYVAGGPDSYCYLNQAEMLASGQIRQAVPIERGAPWPDVPKTFTPTGHLPAAGVDAAIVPACPAGYPMLLATARVLGGRAAMFWVVPIFGGIAVWMTFLLGRHMAGPVAGAAAAGLLASSPAFLYQVTQPMTDVPAAALWTAALVVAIRQPTSIRAGWLSGVLTGAALLVRPNLVPLAAVVAAAVLLVERIPLRAAVLRLSAFAFGVIPYVVAILLLNHAMHGGALDSGYGKLSDLFTLEHIRGNLARYPVWLVETQTPFILLAFAAPWIVRGGGRTRPALWLLAFALATFACYIPYTVWNAWWFLRFVLPAFPPLLVLSAMVAIAGMRPLPAAWRTVAVVVMMSVLVGFQIVTSADRAVFRLRDLEARFRDAGEYVARRLPANAVVFAVTESGSVRFYSGHPTLIWSALDPAWLDRSLEFLSAQGYRPYFLLELDEEPDFRQQFGKSSVLGNLEWPPMAVINRQVKIYDPADYERYRRTGSVATDIVWTKPR